MGVKALFKQAFSNHPLNAEPEWLQTFKPTLNARNTAMIRDAQNFSQVLKALHKDLSNLDRSVDDGLGTVSGVLKMPLPLVYEDSPGGGAFPVADSKEERIVGVAVRLEDIANSAYEMRHKLHEEVLHPIEQWLSAFRAIKERNQRVDALKDELDTKRKLLAAAQEKYEKLRARGNTSAAEDAYYKAQNEADKVARVSVRYTEGELEVYNAVLALVKDTEVLRDYAAAAVVILQKCFTNSINAFQIPAYTPPVYPAGYSAAEASPTQQYTDLADPSAGLSTKHDAVAPISPATPGQFIGTQMVA